MACATRRFIFLASPILHSYPSPAFYGRFRLFGFLPKCFEAKPLENWPAINSVQWKLVQNLRESGRKLLSRSFLGLSTVTTILYREAMVTCAANEHALNFGESVELVKDDIRAFSTFMRKYGLPVLVVTIVFFGWRHPLNLAINLALILFSTRPDPLSVYIFMEQLQDQQMQKDSIIYKSKLSYVRKVDVQDYKALCLAKVESRDSQLILLGILGGWWLLHSSPLRKSSPHEN